MPHLLHPPGNRAESPIGEPGIGLRATPPEARRSPPGRRGSADQAAVRAADGGAGGADARLDVFHQNSGGGESIRRSRINFSFFLFSKSGPGPDFASSWRCLVLCLCVVLLLCSVLCIGLCHSFCASRGVSIGRGLWLFLIHVLLLRWLASEIPGRPFIA